jgi:hypothetical protein
MLLKPTVKEIYKKKNLLRADAIKPKSLASQPA